MVDSINSNQLPHDDQVNRLQALTALEFYSGIGGMRFALEGAVDDPRAVKVLAAFDINPHANQVYLHNFGDAVTSANLDNTMNADKLGRFKADIYLMSPPCQPYTRTGHQNQAADPRSKSFLAFLEALPILDANNKAPKYLFIEKCPRI
ncbi:C-5 cytosine-specific DNA methylase [Entomophthora muscae]|uniref:C-5 cytosine-specific DNA methylase n=1 Tax=Entomophthora muscae TaxID=34485 RepID=A0ACC2U1D6_9FUNG|nr:C-5 cytosine-specific DNA methylase [Entomophthora muscae]